MTWRNLCIALFVIVLVQAWRDCARSPAPPAKPAAVAHCPEPEPRRSHDFPDTTPERDEPAPASAAPAGDGFSINGFQLQVPSWAMWFAPQPGEDLRAYRDRLMPFAKAALAPHRERVARSLDDFAAAAKLDAHQLGELDAASKEAAAAIEDRVMNAVMSGELAPSSFKPMTGVGLARDVLDTVEHANQRFTSSLTDDQRAQLAQHPFDFADYLVFSTRWEDFLGAQ
ncbi:MAG TPA: hypothetical protein VLX92_28825 [Kofleriaceae bacterium]|nr:hypothetical protein [Kofleriaceae bacterium]